jgi:hypothetical protein
MINKTPQFELALIDRNVDEGIIQQRVMDGYINASALCKVSNKNFADYSRLKTTEEFLKELSADMGFPISALIQQIKGGKPELQGTWIHPQVAINLAQWASAKFAVLVSKWVFEWMSGNVPDAHKFPYHIQRYLINRTEIPPTHFSIFNEIVFNLIAPMEDLGYELPDKLVPDISQGRMFAKWVREEKGLEPNNFPVYTHTYPDGRVIPGVKLYPNFLLGDFRDHFHNVRLKNRASKYFVERDKNAIPYLQKMIASLPLGDYFHAISTEKEAKERSSELSRNLATEINTKHHKEKEGN